MDQHNERTAHAWACCPRSERASSRQRSIGQDFVHESDRHLPPRHHMLSRRHSDRAGCGAGTRHIPERNLFRAKHIRQSHKLLIVLFFLTSSMVTVGGTWQVATLTGNGNSANSDGGATSASFNGPRGIAISSTAGYAYVCDSGNGKLRRVSLGTGSVSTLPGSFAKPTDIALLDSGDAAVFTDQNSHNIILYSLTNQTSSVLAGPSPVGTPAHLDGAGTNARFSSPSGIAVISTSGALVVDAGNNRIRHLNTSSGLVSTVAGNGVAGYADGPGLSAQFSFNSPPNAAMSVGVAIDSARTFAVIADNGNLRVRKVDLATWQTSTLAGSGQPGLDDGPSNLAKFSQLKGVSLAAGDSVVIVADGSRIRSIDVQTGHVTTIAGDGTGYSDGSGTSATFRTVYGVGTALNDTAILVSDNEDHRLRVLRNCSDAACSSGQYRPCAANFSLGGDDQCQECAANSYLDSSSSSCVACPSNSVSSQGSTNLSACACASGFYLDLVAASCVSCTAYPAGGCSAGQYWVACGAQADGGCLSCPAGVTSVAGSNGPASCSCAPGFTGSQCTSCAAGTYKSTVGSGACTACPANSTSDANSTDVSDCLCAAGLYGAATGTCIPCPVGTYKNGTHGGECTACPDKTVTLAEGSTAKESCVCQADYFGLAFLRDTGVHNVSNCYNVSVANGTNTICETSQEVLFRFDNDTGFKECTPCPPLSVSAAGSFSRLDCTCQQGFLGAPGQQCTQCPANANTTAGTVATKPEQCLCNPGFYDVNVTTNVSVTGFLCLPCPSGTVKELAGRGECTGCKALDPLSNSSGTGGDDCKCLAGTEPVQGVCTLCQPGFFKAGPGDDNCTACPVGQYQPSSGARTCLSCPANSYNNLPANGRSQCYACRPCPPNSEAPRGSGLRSQCACSKGYTGRAGEVCSACPAGKYKPVLGDSDCLDCSSVGDNLWSDPGASICGCNAGYEGPLGGPCTACAAGTSKGAVGNESCADCAAGTYAPVSVAATVCETCVNGSYSAPLAVNASSCACNAGFEGTPPDSCSACTPGSYKPLAGPSQCVTCPADSYQPDSGQSSCEACPARTEGDAGSISLQGCLCLPSYEATLVYANVTGTLTPVGENCTLCPAGTYKDWFGRDACAACQNNSDSDAGAFRCTCNTGYAEALADPDVCKLCTPYPAGGCPPNTYWKTCDDLDSGCVACPANAGSPNASLSILDCSCNAGYEGERSNCRACEAGFYKGDRGPAPCSRCEEGFYQEQAAGTVCKICTPLQPCPEGQWWSVCPGDMDGHCALCFPEPANAHFAGPGEPLWENNCPSECDEGYERVNGVCTECAAGKFRSVVESSCQDCAAPATNTAPASGYCTKCVQGYYLVAWDYFGHAVCERCASPHTTTLGPAAGFADKCRCDIGYAGFSWACEPCPPGTYKPTISETSDLDRYLGTYVAADNCTACPSGTFSNEPAQVSGAVCEGCPAFSDAVDGSSECLCNAGYYDTDPSFIATCVECPEETYNELRGQDGIAACLSCPDANAYAPAASALATDCQCNVGFSGDHLACVQCAPGSFANERGLAECLLCRNGTVTLSDASTDPFDCRCPTNEYGNYPADGFCTPCPNNSATAGPDSRLRSDCTCNEGYFGDLGDNATLCARCPENMYPWESLFYCSCNAGFYQNQTRVYASVWNATSNATTLALTDQTAGSDMCLQCPADSTSENAAVGEWECFCHAGFYGDPGLHVDCAACPTLSSSPPGSQELGACTCNSGYAGDPLNNVTCGLCTDYDANSFTWDNSVNCTCNAGFYGFSVAAAGSTCQACPSGTYNELTSQSSEAACLACPADSNAPDGSASILDCTCNAGFYRQLIGASDLGCVPCPAATYSNVTGLTDEAQCQACPAFSTSAPASLVVGSCQCAPGYYGPDGAACSPCPNKTLNTEVGMVNATACLPCPPNASSPAGSSACLCAGGFFGDPSRAIPCAACPENTYQPLSGMTSPEACVACPGNFTVSPRASTTCLCEAGYFGQPLAGQACASCPANATAVPGSVSVFQCGCRADFYGNPGRNVSCEPCPALSISAFGSRNISQCLCQPAYYGNPAGNVSCAACPTLATSIAGAQAVSECFCTAGSYGKPECNVSCVPCPDASFSEPGTTTASGCLCNAGFYGGIEAAAVTEVDCAVTTAAATTSTTLLATEYNATTTTFASTSAAYTTSSSLFANTTTATSAAATTSVRRRLLAGSEGNATQFCFACPDNAISQPGSSVLANCSCDVGYYGDPLAGVTCQACPAMSTSALGSKNLSDCQCMPGFYGSPADNATCLPCPGNASSALGSTVKSNCSCNAGFFGDAAVFNRSAPSCAPCPANTYNPLPDQIPASACLRCPSNSTSLAASSVVGQCQCAPGFYGDLSRDAACEACEANTFNPQAGGRTRRACQQCPLNAVTRAEASTGLEDCVCAPGYYRFDISGSVFCLPCPAGTYGPALGQTSVSNCSACPAFSTSRMASSSLADCTCNAGFVLSDRSTASLGNGSAPAYCAACPADTYAPVQNTSACVACPANASSDANSTRCSCFAGYYADGLASCIACPQGTYNALPGQTNATACLACPEGSNTTGPGAPSDQACLCEPGYYGDPAACTACAAGTYNGLANQTAASACLACAGNFTSSTASTACRALVLVNGTYV